MSEHQLIGAYMEELSAHRYKGNKVLHPEGKGDAEVGVSTLIKR